MTDAQAASLEKWRKQYDALGWTVTADERGERIVVTAYGGPRAFRSVFIEPDGSTQSGPMA